MKKQICPYCNKVIKETLFGRILRHLYSISTSIGIFFIILILLIGPSFFVYTISNLGLTMYANKHSDELRHIALNSTTYDGNNPYYFIIDLLENLPHIRYVYPSFSRLIYNPNETYQYGGDCKNQAIMLVSILHSVGHEAYVDCNLLEHHCVVKVPFKESFFEYGRTYMIVEMTDINKYIATVYFNEINHWEQPYNYSWKTEFPKEVNQVEGIKVVDSKKY
jgi:hypothetical protein